MLSKDEVVCDVASALMSMVYRVEGPSLHFERTHMRVRQAVVGGSGSAKVSFWRRDVRYMQARNVCGKRILVLRVMHGLKAIWVIAYAERLERESAPKIGIIRTVIRALRLHLLL